MSKKIFKNPKERANKISKALKGRKLSKEWKRKIGNAQKGEKNHNWKGGIKYSGGYRFIKMPEHPFVMKNGYVAEHRLIMEKSLGRYLKKFEQIHHKNGLKDDNNIENLEIVFIRPHYGEVICPFCDKHFLIR